MAGGQPDGGRLHGAHALNGRRHAPFGSYEQSGVGKELGVHALERNTELESVFISTEP